MKKALILFVTALVLVSCKGTDKYVLRDSLGKVNKVLVVTKASDWNGDLGSEIRNSFGESALDLAKVRGYNESIPLVEEAVRNWEQNKK